MPHVVCLTETTTWSSTRFGSGVNRGLRCSISRAAFSLLLEICSDLFCLYLTLLFSFSMSFANYSQYARSISFFSMYLSSLVPSNWEFMVGFIMARSFPSKDKFWAWGEVSKPSCEEECEKSSESISSSLAYIKLFA